MGRSVGRLEDRMDGLIGASIDGQTDEMEALMGGKTEIMAN